MVILLYLYIHICGLAVTICRQCDPYIYISIRGCPSVSQTPISTVPFNSLTWHRVRSVETSQWVVLSRPNLQPSQLVRSPAAQVPGLVDLASWVTPVHPPDSSEAPILMAWTLPGSAGMAADVTNQLKHVKLHVGVKTAYIHA